MLNIGILISGRGSNMEAIIRAAKNKKIPVNPAIVISNTAGARGIKTAQRLGVKTAVVPSRGFEGTRQEYDQQIIKVLKKHNVTKKDGLVCLAGFMRIISPEFVKKYKNKIINIHPSLLPAFPGLDAQKQAIKYGAKVSGCTVHFVDEGVDTGPIIVQYAVKIKDGDTAESLSKRILKHEHQAYPMALKMIATGKIKNFGKKPLPKT